MFTENYTASISKKGEVILNIETSDPNRIFQVTVMADRVHWTERPPQEEVKQLWTGTIFFTENPDYDYRTIFEKSVQGILDIRGIHTLVRKIVERRVSIEWGS